MPIMSTRLVGVELEAVRVLTAMAISFPCFPLSLGLPYEALMTISGHVAQSSWSGYGQSFSVLHR